MADLPVGPDTRRMAIGVAVVRLLVDGVQGGTVRLESQPLGVLGDILVAAAEDIVSRHLRLVAEIEAGVGSQHIRGGDTVVGGAGVGVAHRRHHTAGEVVETAVVGIVGVAHDGNLVLLAELGRHSGALESEVVLDGVAVGIGSVEILSRADHRVAEPLAARTLDHRKVDDGLLLAVVNSRELGLLRHTVDDLHLLDGLCGQVLGGHLQVIQEEGAVLDRYLLDLLSVGSHLSVLDLDARQALEKVLQRLVRRGLHQGDVMLDGILLDDDRVSGVGNGCAVQIVGLHIHLTYSHIDRLVAHGHPLGVLVVTHHIALQGVLAGLHVVQYGNSRRIGLGVLDGGILAVTGQRYRGKPYGLLRS